jgi:GGDEF domain-containing protein
MSDAREPPAERLARAARGAHDLSDALWASLHESLAGAGGEGEAGSEGVAVRAGGVRAAELAQRLADVSAALVLLASAEHLLSPPAPLEPPEPSPVEAAIQIHDTREEAPAHPSAWTHSIGRRLERYGEDHLPFAVLLIEVLDIDRLAHAEPRDELARLTTQVERAVGAELRPADVLTHEARGRYWLVTPETDAPGARRLAERLARAVRLAAQHRGVPLEVAIGISVCPEDGQDAAALAAHADVGVYAARAAGRSIAPDDDFAA